MILDELFDKTYPNATFHDSLLQHIEIDYSTREATLDFLICIDDPDSADIANRESHCAGRLIYSKLIFFVVEPPDPTYPYQAEKDLWVADAGMIDEINSPTITKLTESMPTGVDIHYFFINEWNAFIYAAAKEARFEWKKT